MLVKAATGVDEYYQYLYILNFGLRKRQLDIVRQVLVLIFIPLIFSLIQYNKHLYNKRGIAAMLLHLFQLTQQQYQSDYNYLFE